MGRTVATWRLRIEKWMERWQDFRRPLSIEEKCSFDRIQTAIRSHASAGGLLPSADPLEPIFLCVLLEQQMEIDRLRQRIERMEGDE